jgi:protein-S-isoprenylcysteine O-methyltransferase Ste14
MSKLLLSHRLVYRIVTILGMLLLFAARRPIGHEPSLWETPLEVGWCLVGLAVIGFAFCWWARIHLGRMWSSSVARKADHHIVDTGPYALVRHPIYTGIIIAAAATAALEARAIAFAGLVLVIIGFWIKARLEERFLRNETGRRSLRRLCPPNRYAVPRSVANWDVHIWIAAASFLPSLAGTTASAPP